MLKRLKSRLVLLTALISLISCLLFIGGWLANGIFSSRYAFDLQVIVSILQVLKGFLDMFLTTDIGGLMIP